MTTGFSAFCSSSVFCCSISNMSHYSLNYSFFPNIEPASNKNSRSLVSYSRNTKKESPNFSMLFHLHRHRKIFHWISVESHVWRWLSSLWRNSQCKFSRDNAPINNSLSSSYCIVQPHAASRTHQHMQTMKLSASRHLLLISKLSIPLLM